MNAFLSLLLFFGIVLAVFGAVYWLVHHQAGFVNLGRVSALASLGLGTLLDQFNMLPWGSILTDAEAKAVGFALAMGMAILHVADQVKKDISGNTP